MSQVTIVRAIRTCIACPSQWDAWDSAGRYWYLRYRHGRGTAELQRDADIATWADKPPEYWFTAGDRLGGYIELDEFCRLAGLGLALDHAAAP